MTFKNLEKKMAVQFYSQPFQLFQHNAWWNDKICIIKKEQGITAQKSPLIYYHIYYTFCIGSLTEDMVLKELVILGKAPTSPRSSGSRSPSVSMSSHCKGRCWAVLLTRTSQLVRRRYTVLFLRKIKGTTVREGGGTSPQRGSVQHTNSKPTLGPCSAVGTRGSQPTEGAQHFPAISIPLFILSN